MKDETRIWLSYASENLDVAILSLDHGHLNACLQNAQQAVEKYLKTHIIELDLPFLRTHSVQELVDALAGRGITPPISEDEVDLMDAIYIPSKYPVYAALPQAPPDQAICQEALDIARRVRDFVNGAMNKKGSGQ